MDDGDGPSVLVNAVLETAANLATNWTTLTNAPRFTGTNGLLLLPANTPPTFHSLRLPEDRAADY